MNISHRGWLRFRQSKGEAGEAMVREPREEGVFLKVDASKLSQRSRAVALAPDEATTRKSLLDAGKGL